MKLYRITRSVYTVAHLAPIHILRIVLYYHIMFVLSHNVGTTNIAALLPYMLPIDCEHCAVPVVSMPTIPSYWYNIYVC